MWILCFPNATGKPSFCDTKMPRAQLIQFFDTSFPHKLSEKYLTGMQPPPQVITKGREPNSAAALASQPATGHSISFYYYCCFMTLGWVLLVGPAAESCSQIWLPRLKRWALWGFSLSAHKGNPTHARAQIQRFKPLLTHVLRLLHLFCFWLQTPFSISIHDVKKARQPRLVLVMINV